MMTALRMTWPMVLFYWYFSITERRDIWKSLFPCHYPYIPVVSTGFLSWKLQAPSLARLNRKGMLKAIRVFRFLRRPRKPGWELQSQGNGHLFHTTDSPWADPLDTDSSVHPLHWNLGLLPAALTLPSHRKQAYLFSPGWFYDAPAYLCHQFSI